MTGARHALVVNSHGGSADSDRIALVRAALDDAGLDYAMYEAEGDPTGPAQRAVRDGCTTLVACGGDGSVGAVAAVALDAGLPLGVVPMGTLNHFARDLGIPDEPVEAVAVLAAGHQRSVDVGVAAGIVFVNNASAGTYARLVAHREQLQEQMGKVRATFAAMRAIFPYRPSPIVLDVDGERIALQATMVFFGNNDYLVEDGRFTRGTLDDGVISVYALRAEHTWDLVRIAFRLARDRIGRERNLVHRTGREVRLTAPGTQMLLAHDGEVETVATPLDVTIRAMALVVITPAPAVEPDAPGPDAPSDSPHHAAADTDRG